MPVEESTVRETAEPPQRSDEPWWPALRPLVRRLHFYAGVFVGPFLLVAALTGLLYIFTPQLEQAVYDHELHVPPSPTTQSLAAQVDAARDALPGAELNAVRPAPTPTDTTQVIFNAPDAPSDSYRRTVFVDPHTSEVRGVLDTYGSSQALPVRTWIDELHRSLHVGDVGRIYSELAASWLWVIALGGLLMWLRRKRNNARSLVAPRLRGEGRRRVLSWHGSVGLWACAGLLFLSATGLTWSLFAGENVSQLRSALSWEAPGVSTDLPSPATGDVGFDRVHAAAIERGVAGPVEITAPGDGAYTVTQTERHWPTQLDSVAVDPGTGQVVSELRFADFPLMAKLARWGVDAHMGLLFGLPNQLVLAALAIGLISMVALGYRMWWLRRPTRGFGSPPERGAWRRVPGRVLAPIILAAAFIAYALPLLGASLLLFLVVDVALGARRTTGV
ncbi:PepSY-associated TM helix domain-containing protein [Saccharopolyspora sp. WRP15-2]|uniref:PepSY-associated TM helix domain-containing protein n=1 Tax=Saccharopolyspora oryzae TaxID=2997343 RepID=A0ABT4V4Q1_9PSEU|nr:PepSY-associated TM helix domain-containing protein [Saccharopolyspora oryzae]MDA3628939.1 PepSY-associated TM helix domain-containing protein [Saccharopolyspora oryzae]